MVEKKRIEALDVMRGITVAAMILFNNPGSWSNLYAPLAHASWNGLTPTDLAYPFFVFIMGISISLSMRKFSDNRPKAMLKICRRTILLYLTGLFLVSFNPICKGSFEWESIRILGVLQRLAIVYFIGATISVWVPRKSHLWVAGVLLFAYVLILNLLNGYAHDSSNLVSIIDCKILGASHLIRENGTDGSFPFEPEGLLSTIPCIAHVLFGIFVGNLLTGTNPTADKIRKIAIFGTALLVVGYLLQYADPVNKKLWTSSYTLVTCGAASLLFALLSEMIDVRGIRFGTEFFKVFGSNALFAYALSSVVAVLFNLWGIKNWIYGNVVSRIARWGGPNFESLVYAVLFVALIWLMAYPLFRKKIFIKL